MSIQKKSLTGRLKTSEKGKNAKSARKAAKVRISPKMSMFTKSKIKVTYIN